MYIRRSRMMLGLKWGGFFFSFLAWVRIDDGDVSPADRTISRIYTSCL